MFQLNVSEKLPEKVSQSMTYGGSVTAVTFGGLSLSEIAAIVGVIVGLAGCIIQFWITRQRNLRENEKARREKELHDRIMSIYDE